MKGDVFSNVAKIILIAGFILALFYYSNIRLSDYSNELDSRNRVIDSLLVEQSKYEEVYRNRIDTVIKYVEVEKVVIKSLPLDSNLLLLQSNLNDSFPALTLDSAVLISESNVQDINIAYLELEGCRLENNLKDSIIDIKDSVIFLKDYKLSIQDSIWQINMRQIEKDIRRDRVKSYAIGGTIGIVAGVIVTGIIVGTLKK